MIENKTLNIVHIVVVHQLTLQNSIFFFFFFLEALYTTILFQMHCSKTFFGALVIYTVTSNSPVNSVNIFTTF